MIDADLIKDLEEGHFDAEPVRKVCHSCGSENVWADANAEWDHENQMWTLGDFLDENNAWCRACDGETRIIDKSDYNKGLGE